MNVKQTTQNKIFELLICLAVAALALFLTNSFLFSFLIVPLPIALSGARTGLWGMIGMAFGVSVLAF